MEKPSNPFSVPPQGLDCTTKVGSRVLDVDIPSKSPFDKGGLCQGSSPMGSM